jgi:NADH:ubiquinone oxidoreductase subunit C
VKVDLIAEALRKVFPAEPVEVRWVPLDEVFVALPSACIHPAVRLFVEQFDLHHLSAITGQGRGDGVELLYHFRGNRGLTLCTRLPMEAMHIATVTDLIPGATFFEREVSEMLGVRFDGHPDPRVLLMPDDWDGEPPLRESGE